MTLAELCELLFPIPDPLDTLEQRERFEHRDLAGLSRAELLRERERLKLRLLLDDAPDPWLFQRLDVLRRMLGDAR